MTEETQKQNVQFIRFKDGTKDDLIGIVEDPPQRPMLKKGVEYIILHKPISVFVETIPEEGRQFIAMHEDLPQSIIDIKEVMIENSKIDFMAPVREEFAEQYLQVSEFYYNNKSTIKNPLSKIPTQEETEQAVQKVVSILDALSSKKDKPVH